MSEDKELKQWKEKLFYQPKNGYDQIDAEQTGEIFAYAEGYKQFLNAARTEREAVKEAIRMAENETDSLKRALLGAKRDSLQARYEAMCGVVRMIRMRQKQQ